MKLSPGIRYMLLSVFFFSLMNIFVKLVPDIPSVEVVLFRSIVSLLLTYAILRRQGVYLWGSNKKILIIRGLAGAIGLILYFTTLQKLPLATAVTLWFLVPVFTAILGIFLVKEKVHPLQWLFFAISFVGILVIKGWDPRFNNSFLLIGIGACFFAAIAYNMIRKLKTTEHPLVIVLYFPLVTLPIAGTWSAFHWVPPQGWDWLYLLLVGVFTQVAQYYMTKAYQLEAVSKVSSLQFVGIVFGLGYGYFFFGETFNLMSYLGIALVLLGVVLNVVFKSRLEKVGTQSTPRNKP